MRKGIPYVRCHMSGAWDFLLWEIVHELVDAHAVPQWCWEHKWSGEQAPFDAYTIPAGPGVWQTMVTCVENLMGDLVHAIRCLAQQLEDRLETGSIVNGRNGLDVLENEDLRFLFIDILENMEEDSSSPLGICKTFLLACP